MLADTLRLPGATRATFVLAARFLDNARLAVATSSPSRVYLFDRRSRSLERTIAVEFSPPAAAITVLDDGWWVQGTDWAARYLPDGTPQRRIEVPARLGMRPLGVVQDSIGLWTHTAVTDRAGSDLVARDSGEVIAVNLGSRASVQVTRYLDREYFRVQLNDTWAHFASPFARNVMLGSCCGTLLMVTTDSGTAVSVDVRSRQRVPWLLGVRAEAPDSDAVRAWARETGRDAPGAVRAVLDSIAHRAFSAMAVADAMVVTRAGHAWLRRPRVRAGQWREWWVTTTEPSAAGSCVQLPASLRLLDEREGIVVASSIVGSVASVVLADADSYPSCSGTR